ncbi:MAG: hypothetical protein H3C58_14030 [Fimbriimonadaceae bacterium]|nr:hypothetical protein [Fimbriimonadaceae bacterium]
MKASECLIEVRRLGADLVWRDGRLFVTPSGALTESLRAEVKRLKPDLVRLLASPPGDELSALRRLCPKFWDIVELRDGRTGLLWGVSRYGVAVWLDPHGPISTIDPRDVAY